MSVRARPPQTPSSLQFFELTENDTVAYGSGEHRAWRRGGELADLGRGAGGMLTSRLKGKLTVWPEMRPSTPRAATTPTSDSPPVTDRLADITRFVTPLLSIVKEAPPHTVTVLPSPCPRMSRGVVGPAVTPVTV